MNVAASRALATAQATRVPVSGAKTVTPAAIRQRRYRQRCYERSGEAWLFVVCRQCGVPIKPSYKRGFCPGGKCRTEFFELVQVPNVVRITWEMHNISTRVLETKKEAIR